VCSARWCGRILDAPAGEQGFGYDPLFYAESEHQSSAQLSRAVKNRISHRALAMREFERLWREQMPGEVGLA
jgi:XTP/dITP diphosphohydrolase